MKLEIGKEYRIKEDNRAHPYFKEVFGRPDPSCTVVGTFKDYYGKSFKEMLMGEGDEATMCFASRAGLAGIHKAPEEEIFVGKATNMSLEEDVIVFHVSELDERG